MRFKAIKELFFKLCQKFWNFVDLIHDKHICGLSLTKYVPSVYRDDKNGVGSTGSQSTRYIILKEIFKHIDISDEDYFVDIGCGKGRVLAFLLSKKLKCKIDGIELNEKVADVAKEWSKKYSNVNIVAGDAFEQDFSKYSVVFIGRPFLPNTFIKFIEFFEKQFDHKITFIYWVDQQSGYMLKTRKGWTMKYRSSIFKKCGLPLSKCPQCYSIWEYDPNKND